MKYWNYDIVFREFPDEVTLAINITNCPHRCDGCHSTYLRENIGKPLTLEAVEALVETGGEIGITCIGFMGGDAEMDALFNLNKLVKERWPNIKTGWYSGWEYKDTEFRMFSWRMPEFDYVKIGPYRKELGPLDSPTTNQVMFKRMGSCSMMNITKRFQEKPFPK